MLVSKEEIQQHRAISKSVKENVLKGFIEDSEINDLLPLLGEKFYFAIEADPGAYTDLLDEKSYVFDEVTVKNPGLKKVLSIFVNARYILFGDQTDTPFGMVEKQYQDGRSVERSGKKERYKLEQQTAYRYWSQVKLFLDRNADTYPLWGAECNSGRRTFKLNKITI